MSVLRVAVIGPARFPLAEPFAGGLEAHTHALVTGLRRRGHDVTVAGGWTLGRLSAVSRTPDGVLRAAANPRGAQGYAVGR